MRTSITIFTTSILVVGIVATVFLVQREQQLRGRAAEKPAPTPTPIGLVGDFDGSGVVDSLDYNVFLQLFEKKDTSADLDKSGQVNSLDLNLFLSLMER